MFELPEINDKEAKSLLTKTLVRKDSLDDEKRVTELLEQLTYLPLAITQAGAYLIRNRVSIATYVELLQGDRAGSCGVDEPRVPRFHSVSRLGECCGDHVAGVVPPDPEVGRRRG
jgi:hypothetical protein